MTTDTEERFLIPGSYPGIPMDEYQAWDAISNSRLQRLSKSPAHLRVYIEEPHVETPALKLGSAVHSAILEPGDFEAKYIYGPEGDRRTKAVKEEWAELIEEFGAEFVLKPADYDACEAMKDSVHSLTTAHLLLSGPGEVELSCVWGDIEAGLTCKGRMDRYSPELAGGAVVDLKSCRDASPREFERSIFTFGYFMQGAYYLAGAEALGMPAEHFTIIAVEKTPPYAAAVYRLTEQAIEAGLEKIRPLLDRYAELQEIPMEDWPAYEDRVRDVGLPEYGYRQVAADLQGA